MQTIQRLSRAGWATFVSRWQGFSRLVRTKSREKALWLIFGGIIAGGILIGSLPLAVLIPLEIVLGGMLLGMIIILLTAQQHFKKVFMLFMIALILRVGLALVLYLLASSNATYAGIPKIGTPIEHLEFYQDAVLPDRQEAFFLGKDDWVQSENGVFVAQYWKRGIFLDQMGYSNIRIPAGGVLTKYAFWAAWIYYHVGYSPMTLFMVNAVIGAFFVLLVYLTGREVADQPTAWFAAVMATVWPSFVLWSTQNLKDMPIDFFIILTFLAGICAVKYYRSIGIVLSALVCGFVGLAALVVLRPFIVVAVVGGMGFAVFMTWFSKRSRRIKQIVCVGIIGVMVIIVTMLSTQLDVLMQKAFKFNVPCLFIINNLRQGLATGNLAILPDLWLENYWQVALYLPIGVMAAFLGPFPWMMGSASQLICLPEMIVYYFLMPAAWQGACLLWRRRRYSAISSLCLFWSVLIMLGLIEGNIGTMFRHRSMVLFVFFICAALGYRSRHITTKV